MAKKPVKPINYQAAKTELDTIMEQLQLEELDIEAATAKYERGLQLVAELEQFLNEAENKITELKTKFSATENKEL
jgi:exodeoxyribonuclease VII small subunit